MKYYCEFCGAEKDLKTFDRSKKESWCFCNKEIPHLLHDKKFSAWIDKKIKSLNFKNIIK